MLTTIKQSQDLALAGIKTFYDAANKAFPMPNLGALPNPRELAKTTFGVVEAVIGLQKEFVAELSSLVSA